MKGKTIVALNDIASPQKYGPIFSLKQTGIVGAASAVKTNDGNRERKFTTMAHNRGKRNAISPFRQFEEPLAGLNAII